MRNLYKCNSWYNETINPQQQLVARFDVELLYHLFSISVSIIILKYRSSASAQRSYTHPKEATLMLYVISYSYNMVSNM